MTTTHEKKEGSEEKKGLFLLSFFWCVVFFIQRAFLLLFFILFIFIDRTQQQQQRPQHRTVKMPAKTPYNPSSSANDKGSQGQQGPGKSIAKAHRTTTEAKPAEASKKSSDNPLGFNVQSDVVRAENGGPSLQIALPDSLLPHKEAWANNNPMIPDDVHRNTIVLLCRRLPLIREDSKYFVQFKDRPRPSSGRWCSHEAMAYYLNSNSVYGQMEVQIIYQAWFINIVVNELHENPVDELRRRLSCLIPACKDCKQGEAILQYLIRNCPLAMVYKTASGSLRARYDQRYTSCTIHDVAKAVDGVGQGPPPPKAP
jgi:hypothetical protein